MKKEEKEQADGEVECLDELPDDAWEKFLGSILAELMGVTMDEIIVVKRQDV